MSKTRWFCLFVGLIFNVVLLTFSIVLSGVVRYLRAITVERQDSLKRMATDYPQAFLMNLIFWSHFNPVSDLDLEWKMPWLSCEMGCAWRGMGEHEPISSLGFLSGIQYHRPWCSFE